MQNNGNPEQLLKQIVSQGTPEQKQALLQQAKKYNVPEHILAKIQNIK